MSDEMQVEVWSRSKYAGWVPSERAKVTFHTESGPVRVWMDLKGNLVMQANIDLVIRPRSINMVEIAAEVPQ